LSIFICLGQSLMMFYFSINKNYKLVEEAVTETETKTKDCKSDKLEPRCSALVCVRKKTIPILSNGWYTRTLIPRQRERERAGIESRKSGFERKPLSVWAAVWVMLTRIRVVFGIESYSQTRRKLSRLSSQFKIYVLIVV